MSSPFFHCSGGDLIAGQVRLSPQDARALDALYRDEVAAATHAFDPETAMRAGRLAKELRDALVACARWRKASGALQRR